MEADNSEGFPIAINRTIIRTEKASTMIMAVYKTEEFTENTQGIADKFLKEQAKLPHDII